MPYLVKTIAKKEKKTLIFIKKRDFGFFLERVSVMYLDIYSKGIAYTTVSKFLYIHNFLL